MKLLILANSCKWKSWNQKLEKLSTWFSPKIELDITLKHTDFQDIPWSIYSSDDSTQIGFKGIDPVWYDKNVTPLGIGYDVVLLVLDRKDWKSLKARGWRTDYDQGPVQLHIGAGENENMKWTNFPPMSAFFQLARHEILHACYMLSGQYDMTHHYWNRGEIEKALSNLNMPKDLRTATLLRTVNWLKSVLDRLRASQSTVPPLPEPPIEGVLTNSERLYKGAKSYLGKNMTSPGIPGELGCASSLNNVFKLVFGVYIGGGASTAEMFKVLKTDPRFEEVTVPRPGDILMNATGTSTKGAKNGHTGVYGETHVMSNNSITEKWDAHYTHQGWIDRFETQKGFKTRIFRVK